MSDEPIEEVEHIWPWDTDGEEEQQEAPLESPPIGEIIFPERPPEESIIPSALRDLRRWLCWREEERGGDLTKVPYDAKTGRPASSTDASTWTDFDTALTASNDYDGLGIALGDGLTGVDLDHCRNPETGEIASWAQKIINALDSYCEVSPSGGGVHVLCQGHLPKGRRRKGDIELYDDGRYFTVTGEHVAGTPTTVNDRTEALAALHKHTFPPAKERAPARNTAPAKHHSLSDSELLKKMFAAKNGRAVQQLWEGGQGNYRSQSEATIALLNSLAFWCGPDPERIDALFRKSGLMRPKWDEKRSDSTWGRQEIDKVLSGKTEFYTPRAKQQAAPAQTGEAKKKRELKQSEQLVRLVEGAGAELFTDHSEVGYCRMPIDDHEEVWPITGTGSGGLQRWLGGQFRAIESKPPGAQAVHEAQMALDAIADFHGPTRALHNRVAWQPDERILWYDLADPEWRAVRIDAHGWSVEDRTPPEICFRRYQHQQPQVVPEHGGSATNLLNLVNIPLNYECLFLCFVATSLLPDIPRPMLILVGPQGSAKTATARATRRCIDPSLAPLLSRPQDQGELAQQLYQHYAAFFDNLTSIPIWLSDCFCRAVTGEGYSKRRLYTDEDSVIFAYRRQVGLTAVSNPVNRPDLLDRSLIFNLHRLPAKKRVSEAELNKQLTAALPGIMGGIFDALSGAISRQADIDIPQPERMVDFTIWGAAVAPGLGYSSEQFLADYGQHVEDLNMIAIESQPFAEAIIQLMDENIEGWQGTASQLLKTCNDIAARKGIETETKLWPGAPRWVRTRLDEAETNLAEIGINVEHGKTGGRKTIAIEQKVGGR